MDFRPLATMERETLIKALRHNAEGETALKVDRQTSFAGELPAIDDAEVIDSIRSVPCHYERP